MKTFLLFVTLSLFSFAGRYDHLKKFDIAKPKGWNPEVARFTRAKPQRSLNIRMKPYYDAFKENGEVNVYFGHGIDGWTFERPKALNDMLFKEVGTHSANWKFDETTRTISFTRKSDNVDFRIKVGYERNEFAKAFEKNQIVMYHGHSRYGRGPAFEVYSHYFRIGYLFPVIEVDTRNPYFLNEDILETDVYPVKKVDLNGKSYSYQYDRQKDHTSYLPDPSYIKRIEGNGKDWREASFLDGKQIYFMYSCENEHYWKDPIRDTFPDTSDRIVFGTVKTSYWSSVPGAVFLSSIIKQVDDSRTIVDSLNATKDCGENCFSAY